jgi:L-threonylcarbamoyladenylate synthase
MRSLDWKDLAEKNLENKVFILPTDTIYGFSALAFDKSGIEKIYQIKKRERNKPMINLISSISDLKKFNVELDQRQKDFLKKIWPGPVSVILKNKRGEKTSFRIPAKKDLLEFIKKVGPIVSTSLNISGENHLSNPKDFNFGGVDFLINEGELNNQPSIIIEIIR